MLGYPEDVKTFDYGNNLGVVLNAGVYDMEHGTILKLGEGRVVS